MLAAVLLCASVQPLTIYASERGRDEWPGTAGRPFRSLARVRQAVLTLRAEANLQPVTVKLKGHFTLSDTLELGSEFSQVTVQGPATISGGIPVRNWAIATANGKQVWEAVVPAGRLYRQLFAEDGRRPRARLPRSGFFHLASADAGEWNIGQDSARYHPADLEGITNLSDVDLVAHHFWVQSRMMVASLDRAASVVRFDRKSVFRLSDDYGRQAAAYRIENAIEGLQQPGDWVCEPKTGRILYVPKRGEGRRGFTATLCSVPVLVHVKRARNLRIEDVAFEHTEWDQPNAGDVQAATSVPGAVRFEETDGCTLSKCRLDQLGGYAVEIIGGKRNAIERCRMSDLGAGGVKVGHGSSGTRISDCTIERGGRLFGPAVGVWIGNSGNNLVSHNRIDDLYYTAISVGWTWGYGPSDAVGNVIEYNDISNIGQGELSDMGGIYTLGVSHGTVLDHNRIRNVQARGYGGWGIYLDEGSTDILVKNNLVQDTKTGGFHQHYGRDNMVRNNVFLNAANDGQIIRTRKEDHKSFTFERNVVVYKGTDLLGGNWDGDGFTINRNVYWRTDGQQVTIRGKSLDEWRGQGRDEDSVVRDPMMTITKRGVEFRRGSPANWLGISPINLSTVGPRR